MAAAAKTTLRTERLERNIAKLASNKEANNTLLDDANPAHVKSVGGGFSSNLVRGLGSRQSFKPRDLNTSMNS